MKNSRCRMAVLSIHSSPAGKVGEKDTGGMSIYLRELSRELSRLGFQVDIFTRSKRGNDGKIELLEKGVRLVHIEAGPRRIINKEKLSQYVPELVKGIEQFRTDDGAYYDIIFSHYWVSGLVGEELKNDWQVPHAIMFHTLGAAKNAAGAGTPEPACRLEAEIKLALYCSHIIVPTEREKEALLEWCGAPAGKVSVIPCGVNLELFRPVNKKSARENLGLDQGEKIALYTGRLDQVKGIELLLESLTFLQVKDGFFRLLLVGGGKNEIEAFRELSRKLQLPFPVEFKGAVEHRRMPEYYCAADLFVLPSYYESFGLAALEAMACGTPVVAADAGIMKDIVRQGETGYVVPTGSPGALAEKMGHVINNPGNYSPSLARKTVSVYSWPVVAHQVGKKCLELTEEHRPGLKC